MDANNFYNASLSYFYQLFCFLPFRFHLLSLHLLFEIRLGARSSWPLQLSLTYSTIQWETFSILSCSYSSLPRNPLTCSKSQNHKIRVHFVQNLHKLQDKARHSSSESESRDSKQSSGFSALFCGIQSSKLEKGNKFRNIHINKKNKRKEKKTRNKKRRKFGLRTFTTSIIRGSWFG